MLSLKMITSNPHSVNTHHCDWSTLTSAEKRHGYLVTKCSACCFSKVYSLHFNYDILLVRELKNKQWNVNMGKLSFRFMILDQTLTTSAKVRPLLLSFDVNLYSTHLFYLWIDTVNVLHESISRGHWTGRALVKLSTKEENCSRVHQLTRFKPKPCARGMW